MSALELAAELAKLQRDQRNRLLAALPAPQRETLERLVDEMQPLAQQAPGAFARLMDELAARAPGPQRDGAALTVALRDESDAVRQRLELVFRDDGDRTMTPHVRALVAAFVDDHAAPAALNTRSPILPRLAPARARAQKRWRLPWQ